MRFSLGLLALCVLILMKAYHLDWWIQLPPAFVMSHCVVQGAIDWWRA